MDDVELTIHSTYDAKKNSLKIKDVLAFDPSFSEFLTSQDPPKIDFGSSKSLRKYNQLVCKKLTSISFTVPPDFLIPTIGLRITYLELIFDKYLKKGARLVEIGTGASAILSMIAAKKYQASICATEINQESIEWALKNIKKNNLEKAIQVIDSKGGLIHEVIPKEEYDLIFSFPPFYNEETMQRRTRGFQGQVSELTGESYQGIEFSINLFKEVYERNNKEKKFCPYTSVLLASPKRTAKLVDII
ncbi:MAG: RlmF-related methyltransferase, partial [Candidatus Kariarchaeaceae archaeon]